MFSLLKRKSHLHWHTTYFKTYVTFVICHIFPLINDPTIDFKKLWKNILTNSSLDLMKLLVTQYTQDMTILDQEIERYTPSIPTW